MTTKNEIASNGIMLADLSTEALAKEDNTYPISVDYEKSIENRVKSGQYDEFNHDINSRNFSTNRKGTAEVKVALIHFLEYVSTNNALKEIYLIGMRPIKLHELLAFGEKYPDVQREFPIVALNSAWWDTKFNSFYVPYLCQHKSKRYLCLRYIDIEWDKLYRFAAVRK